MHAEEIGETGEIDETDETDDVATARQVRRVGAVVCPGQASRLLILATARGLASSVYSLTPISTDFNVLFSKSKTIL